MYFPRNFRKQAGVQAKFVEEDESFEMFPPFHRGIPVVDVEKSIGKHRSNISSMRSALGMSEEAFSLIVLPAIRNLPNSSAPCRQVNRITIGTSAD